MLDARQVRVTEPSPATPMRRGEVAGVLGSLALALSADAEDEQDRSRYSGLARAYLEVAVEEEPANARARAALARARALGGDADGAEQVLASALRDAPADPYVQRDAGHVALAAEAAKEAEARFRTAIELDEQSPAAWFGLGRALAIAGQSDSALVAFERARSLGWSADIDLELSRLHLAAKRASEARALLVPLASDPHGGSIAKQAAELLRQIDSPDDDQR